MYGAQEECSGSTLFFRNILHILILIAHLLTLLIVEDLKQSADISITFMPLYKLCAIHHAIDHAPN